MKGDLAQKQARKENISILQKYCLKYPQWEELNSAPKYLTSFHLKSKVGLASSDQEKKQMITSQKNSNSMEQNA